MLMPVSYYCQTGDSRPDGGHAVMVNVSSIFHLEFLVPLLLSVGILQFTKLDVQQVLTTGLCGSWPSFKIFSEKLTAS